MRAELLEWQESVERIAKGCKFRYWSDSGVHPKTAQENMRHSDINLTLGHYTHKLRDQEAEAASNPDDKANSLGAIKNRISEYPRKDSNLQPLAPEANALSNWATGTKK